MVMRVTSALDAGQDGMGMLDDRGIGCCNSLEAAQECELDDGVVAGGYNWEEVLYY